MKHYLGLALLLLGLQISPAQAKTFALVIGIDQYSHLDPLAGAVNDAKDIYSALKENSVAANDLHFLTNQDASKEQIKSAWDDMVTRSSSGDTLIVTYAGHGSQVPDTGSTLDEIDGSDEAFLLSGYQEVGVNSQDHRIIDDEWYRWFSAVSDRQVVFVADSCHSGSMTRSVATANRRFQKVSTAAIPPPTHANVKEREHPNHVTFFAATTEDMDSYERNINGKARGALSYAFAEAIRGAADNGDKVLRKQELEIYLYNTITKLTEGTNKQIPQIIPEGSFANKPLISLNRSVQKDQKSGDFKVSFSRGNNNHSGAKIQLAIDNPRYPYLTLYNLAGNGSIQFLWPLAEDSPRIATDRQFVLPLDVDTIQGEEQLIAILSKTKQGKLHQFLSRKNKSFVNNQFDTELSKLLAHEEYDIQRVQHVVKGKSL